MNSEVLVTEWLPIALEFIELIFCLRIRRVAYFMLEE